MSGLRQETCLCTVDENTVLSNTDCPVHYPNAYFHWRSPELEKLIGDLIGKVEDIHELLRTKLL